MQEMLNYYESLKNKKIFEIRPNFNLDVPDVINEKKKDISSQLLKGRERSNTTFTGLNTNNYKSIGGVNNFHSDKKNSFSYYNTHSMTPSTSAFNEGEFKVPSNSGMKIPMNNPLASLGKVNLNKFDDPSLNPMTLSFNSMNLNQK
jgi:hypothetical protein